MICIRLRVFGMEKVYLFENKWFYINDIKILKFVNSICGFGNWLFINYLNGVFVGFLNMVSL